MTTSTKYNNLRLVSNSNSSLSEATPSLIQIENLKLCYGKQTIFEHINLPIFQKKINTLIGPSGCGKSSLLHSIIRLTDHEEKARLTGSIYLEKQNIVSPKMDLIQLRRNIAMIFQRPVPFPMSIRKNFEIPLYNL